MMIPNITNLNDFISGNTLLLPSIRYPSSFNDCCIDSSFQFFLNKSNVLIKYSGVLPVGNAIIPLGLSRTHSRKRNATKRPNS